MNTTLDYLLPATIFYIFATICYGLLALTGLTEPIDWWWARLGGAGTLLDGIGYLAVVSVFTWLANRQDWRRHFRWIVQIGSRRGLRLARMPVVDFGLLIALVLSVLLAVKYIPTAVGAGLCLIVPLSIAIVTTLVFGRPDPLDDVIEEPATLQAYAAKHGIDFQTLARENDVDPATDPQLQFSQTIQLPPS